MGNVRIRTRTLGAGVRLRLTMMDASTEAIGASIAHREASSSGRRTSIPALRAPMSSHRRSAALTRGYLAAASFHAVRSPRMDTNGTSEAFSKTLDKRHKLVVTIAAARFTPRSSSHQNAATTAAAAYRTALAGTA